MALLLKLIKVVAKALTVLVGLLVIFYVVLLLINIQDEAPSADAITMQELQLTTMPDAEQRADSNGYLYMSRHDSAAQYQLSAAFSELMRQCNVGDCNAALSAQPGLELLVTQHQAIIDFYQQIHGFTYWYEPVVTDPAQAIPSYQSLLNGQQLMLVQAWLAAQQQDVATVRQLLQQDLQFWRNLLPKHNMLIGKLISAEAIKRHFNFAAAIQQQLAPQYHAAMQPETWLTPFSDEELSMLQVLAGEWMYGNAVTESVLVATPLASNSSMGERLMWQLIKPLFLVQASSNLRAGQLLAQAAGDSTPGFPWYSWLYNPVGKLLNSEGYTAYTGYRSKVIALEALRQQLVISPVVE